MRQIDARRPGNLSATVLACSESHHFGHGRALFFASQDPLKRSQKDKKQWKLSFLILLSSGAYWKQLVDELIDARDHFRLHQNLDAATLDYGVEFNRCPVFWSMTLSADM
jgi:hypothetical protein